MERPIRGEKPSDAGSPPRGTTMQRVPLSASASRGLRVDQARMNPKRFRTRRGVATLVGLGVIIACLLWVPGLRNRRLDRAPGQVIGEFALR